MGSTGDFSICLQSPPPEGVWVRGDEDSGERETPARFTSSAPQLVVSDDVNRWPGAPAQVHLCGLRGEGFPNPGGSISGSGRRDAERKRSASIARGCQGVEGAGRIPGADRPAPGKSITTGHGLHRLPGRYFTGEGPWDSGTCIRW